MRVWIDITAPAHVLVFRPLIELLHQRGARVETTARDYSQTLELLDSHGIDAHIFGQHGGRTWHRKARSMATRMARLARWARPRRFDIALAHGSHELTLTARLLGIPSATTHDYEFASLQHRLGFRAATRVVVPDAIPVSRLQSLGVSPSKLVRYPGLKEEYYLADFQPDPGILPQLGIDPSAVLVVLRPPSDVSLYHRESPLFRETLDRTGHADGVVAVVLPRTDEQRRDAARLTLPSMLLPRAAVDAQSLIAYADAVVSAGGTMNREAAALGVPAYTTFGGRLGGVDEALIHDGRLRRLRDAQDLPLQKREGSSGPVRRDPATMLRMLLGEPEPEPA